MADVYQCIKCGWQGVKQDVKRKPFDNKDYCPNCGKASVKSKKPEQDQDYKY